MDSTQPEARRGLLIRRRELLCLGASGAVALLPTGCSSPSDTVEKTNAVVPAGPASTLHPTSVEPVSSASSAPTVNPEPTESSPPEPEVSASPPSLTPPASRPNQPYEPVATSAPTPEPTPNTGLIDPPEPDPPELHGDAGAPPEPEPVIQEPVDVERDAGTPATPNFDEVASCVLTPTDRAGEGPFFIHDDEVMDDPSLFRSDLRDGREGVEFEIHLRVLDQAGDCAVPIAGVEVYVWHTDALGFYSGFADQNPDQSYMGGAERQVENADRFCRGAGVTDANGVVSFRSLYPGWYNGRALHVHFVCLRPGSGPDTASYRGSDYHVFTTQFYFDEAFSRDIHENNPPYNQRLSGGYDTYVRPETDVRPTLTKTGNVVQGALNIVTVGNESRGGATGGGFGGF
jgi:protocatechuate 3,4-dioxygenase beta subunit